MMFLKNAIKLFVFCLLMNSCAQLSSLQTGKVYEKGEGVIGLAGFAYGLQESNSATTGSPVGQVLLPYLEVYGRTGIANNVDAGLKLSSAGNIQLDGRWQFVGDRESKYAMALGAGWEFQASDFNAVLVSRTHLPLYLSVHPNERTAVYLTPHFIFQTVSNDNNSTFLGGSFGLQRDLNEKWRGVIEGSIFSPQTQNVITESTLLYQFGIGLVRRLGSGN